MTDRYESIPYEDKGHINPSPIPFQKFQSISIDDYADESVTEAQHQKFLAALLPALTPFMEDRDNVVAEIATTEAKIQELKASRDKLLIEVEELKAKGSELAQAGNSPLGLKKKQRAAEGDAADLEEWVSDLSAHLEGLYGKGNSAEFSLFNAWNEAQAVYAAEAQAALDMRLQEISAELIGFTRGMALTYREIMKPGAYPGKFNLRHDQLQGRKAFTPLKLSSRRSLFGVIERFAHHLEACIA